MTATHGLLERSGGGGGSLDWRTGDAYYFSNGQADTRCDNLLAHGHAVGFHFANGAAALTCKHLWTEYVADAVVNPSDKYNGSIGLLFDTPGGGVGNSTALTVLEWYCTSTTVCVQGNIGDYGPPFSDNVVLGFGQVQGTTGDAIEIKSGNWRIGPVNMDNVGASALNISSASSFVQMSGVINNYGTRQPILVPQGANRIITSSATYASHAM